MHIGLEPSDAVTGHLDKVGKGGGCLKKDGISLENGEEKEGICGW